MDERYDVVVVGGGAAGLSGAVALARSRRRVLVVDAGQPRNAPASGVHNLLGSEGASPAELLARGRADLASYGGEVVEGRAVTARRLDGDEPSFELELADGSIVSARRLLVASGGVDVLPDLPGLAERWGRDVLHCPYCHGWEVADRRVGVLATSAMAAHQALLFQQLADVVLLAHTGPPPTGDEQAELSALAVETVDGEVTALEVVGDRLTGVRVGDRLVPLDALVVTTRVEARSAVLESLGLRAEPVEMNGVVLGSAVPADPTGLTAVPGVWVAGNVTAPMAQVVVSAGAGLMAGAVINGDLVREDARRALRTRLVSVAS